MLGSSTVSVGSSILKSRLENGRTYHSYKDGSKYSVYGHWKTLSQSEIEYAFPDDEV